MTEKKYALHPGYVVSYYDGDRHYISATKLAELYRVDMKNCIIVDSTRPELSYGYNKKKMINLYPNKHGMYDRIRDMEKENNEEKSPDS